MGEEGKWGEEKRMKRWEEGRGVKNGGEDVKGVEGGRYTVGGQTKEGGRRGREQWKWGEGEEKGVGQREQS